MGGINSCDALDGFEWLRFRNRAMVLASRLNPRITDGMSRSVLEDEIQIRRSERKTLSEKSQTKLGIFDVGSCSPDCDWTKCEVQHTKCEVQH